MLRRVYPCGWPVFLALVTAMGAAPLARQQPAPAPGSAQPPGAPAPGAASRQAPARDRKPGEAERGTAVIRGVVVAADTGTPLRRANVRVVPSGGMGGVGGMGIAQTDAQGGFEVRDLASGRYIVTASRSGYVTMQLGQRAANQPGTPVELAEGQVLDKVNFALARGGAIAGRIVDDLGEPVAGAQVMAQRYAYMGGARRLVPGGSDGGGNDRTDDLGQFRLYGLTPGEYYISAVLRAMDFMPVNSTSGAGPTEGFAPTFFPGVSSVSEARRVTVRAGQDVTGVSFTLVSARLARISGRVTTSRGEPLAGGMVMIAPRTDTPLAFASMTTAQVRADGTFMSAGLAPGTYVLTAGDRNMDQNGEVGRMDVQVDGNDARDVFIVTGRGGVVRGRIVTDEGTVPPFKPGQVRIFMAPVDETRTTGFGFRPPKVNEDWTFEGAGLTDAVRLNISFDVPGASWSARHAWKDNVDLLDTGVDTGPGQTLEDVEIVITQKRTELSGQIADDRGQPVTDAWVVVFPDDKEGWTFGSRYVRPSRPDTNGKYTTRLTPHDSYRVIVVRGLEDGQFSDPEFLTRALEHATAFRIQEGESKVLNLRLADVK